MALTTNTQREEKFVLSVEEKIKISEEVARVRRQARQAEADRKSANSQYKSQINRLESEAQEKDDILLAGYKLKKVDCKVVYDIDTRTKRIISLESGKELEKEAMTQREVDDWYEEQQTDLFEDLEKGLMFKHIESAEIITVTKIVKEGEDFESSVVQVDSDDFVGDVEVSDILQMGYELYADEDAGDPVDEVDGDEADGPNDDDEAEEDNPPQKEIPGSDVEADDEFEDDDDLPI